jgi:hypothetical protein
MNDFIKTYGKSLAQVGATILAAIFAAGLGDGIISAAEWVNVAILAVGAAAVFTAPNVPGASHTKSVLAALTAGLTVLASAILGGVSTAEWYQIGAAVVGAIGVYAAPYKPTLNRST